ncbi:rRNA maturation RNase YbeY [Brevibacterium paucivorans]
MSIELGNETEHQVDLERVHECARFALDTLNVHPAVELSIRFISDDVMSELHDTWMGLPGTTDVMSFPMDELKPGHDEPGVLGDIVISPSVATEQATAAGHSVSDEIYLLTVHGILHLLGYDHHEPDEKEEMFALQRKLLLMWFAQIEPGRTHVPQPTEE